jgi:hypothetical protein
MLRKWLGGLLVAGMLAVAAAGAASADQYYRDGWGWMGGPGMMWGHHWAGPAGHCGMMSWGYGQQTPRGYYSHNPHGWYDYEW